MASVFSLQPLPSSSFICPLKTTKFQTLQSFQKPFLISSFQSTELDPKIPQPVQTFWQWLCDEGVVTAKTPVKPGIVPEGLGLVAKRDISKGETVLQVPRRLWINTDVVELSELGNVCSGLEPWISLSLFLLREKWKDDSKWKYYIGVLPECTDSTIYWSEEELSEIQGTQLLSETMSVKDYWQNEFRKVEEEVILRNKQLFPFPITLDDFFWAYGILKSRAFSSIGSQNLMLVPLADLVNHSAKVATEGHVQEVEGPAGLFSWDLLFSLRSPLELKAGDQFLVQYGLNKRNADLAFGYGFIEPNSARDAFTLTLEISESDDFYEDKLDIAESNGLGKTAEFNVKLGQSLPPTLIPYLRLVALGGTDAFLLESISRNDVWGHLELPVSRANEELICKVVRGTCKSALSGYHTTIEEDEKLMEKGNLSSRLQIAVGIRAGEKKVLQQIDDIFGERELKLDKLEYYQERRLKDQVTLC
ncbi:ribulose-1,5 bisphosphate carboxylase/oxygenase large subunit N-methyltransferase, chloroplastic-like isoform X2 [Lycium barbarum]|uniref:ribulose-1,5 bisphosphate carboxylase/oxygenase large subunit N-methyltransferase, chloroplastic-like isoform X2 n=1 Tax=Lycium barbarum TaxID=112863 RepID=UPI00293F714A|nr:ribulose-1,5 bisphosphate carboxylase/oxygenase large subunit N-methyltransferase, chloroplastic-like isoform X2 [Lycium barbarum]